MSVLASTAWFSCSPTSPGAAPAESVPEAAAPDVLTDASTDAELDASAPDWDSASADDADAQTDSAAQVDASGIGEELGKPCADGADCTSGFCENGVCCESDCQACADCGPSGQCDVVPETDDACPAVLCTDGFECRVLSAPGEGECVGLNECSTEADCVYTNRPLGALCGEAGACDGLGECSLVRDGSSCSEDASCASGTCLSGTCGRSVTDCSQLGAAPQGIVEVPGTLRNAWPPRNRGGAAILIDGVFDDDPMLCFGAEPLPAVYHEAASAVIQIPMDAPLGGTSVRRLLPDGRVSTPIIIDVVADYAPSPSYEVDDPEPGLIAPLFIDPGGVVIPDSLAAVPPITNVWRDIASPSSPFSRSWTFGGDAEGIEVRGHLQSAQPPQVGGPTAIQMTGAYDLEHHRIVLTFQNTQCADLERCVWNYIGLFSCSGNSILEHSALGPVDLCSETALELQTMNPHGTIVSSYIDIMTFELVLFSVSEPLPQGVLKKDGRQFP